MDKTYQGNIELAKELLKTWIKHNTSYNGWEWLNKKIGLIKESNQKKDIYLAFSLTSRFVGKEKLKPTKDELIQVDKARKGWKPQEWTIDQAARILLLLSISSNDPVFYISVLKQLFETAEVAEHTALYLGLPLYPYPNELKSRAVEGFRTNINVVFNAIALNSPYPMEYLDEAEWNQMVLKAIFIGSPLYMIHGIDQRANSALAKTLTDFVHERWAAGRPVTPELWRNFSQFIDDHNIKDLERAILSENLLEQQAAALTLSQSKSPLAKELVGNYPALSEKINHQKITWDQIGKEWEISFNNR